jgi:hypothetical protein
MRNKWGADAIVPRIWCRDGRYWVNLNFHSLALASLPVPKPTVKASVIEKNLTLKALAR